jgi:hypothetical protein
MKWIVVEDKQTSGTFIAVIGIPEYRRHTAEQGPCSRFRNKQEALERAFELKRQLHVNDIREFTLEGV